MVDVEVTSSGGEDALSSRVGRLHHLIERGRQEDGPDLILKSDLTKIAATEVKLARLDGSLTLLVQRDVDAPGRRSTPPAYGVGKRQLCEEDRQGDWTWLARVTETNGADADGVSMPAYVASVLCVVVMWELAIRPRSISSPTHTRLLARLLIHSLTLSFSSSPPCTHSLTRSHTHRGPWQLRCTVETKCEEIIAEVIEHESYDDAVAARLKLIVNGRVLQRGKALGEYLEAGKGRTCRVRNFDGTKRAPEHLPQWKSATPFAGVVWVSSYPGAAVPAATTTAEAVAQL